MLATQNLKSIPISSNVYFSVFYENFIILAIKSIIIIHSPFVYHLYVYCNGPHLPTDALFLRGMHKQLYVTLYLFVSCHLIIHILIYIRTYVCIIIEPFIHLHTLFHRNPVFVQSTIMYYESLHNAQRLEYLRYIMLHDSLNVLFFSMTRGC